MLKEVFVPIIRYTLSSGSESPAQPGGADVRDAGEGGGDQQDCGHRHREQSLGQAVQAVPHLQETGG